MLARVAVIDTSVLIALDHLGLLGYLGSHYERVLVPSVVRGQLLDAKPEAATTAMTVLIDAPPFEPCDQYDLAALEIFKISLDPGEAEAMAQMQSREADYLLIDEKKGRRVAKSAGHSIVGTATILAEMHFDGVTNFLDSIKELRAGKQFRVSERVVTLAFSAALQRRGK